jgi:hypothetical protein
MLEHVHITFGSEYPSSEILASFLCTLPTDSRVESIRLGEIWPERAGEWRRVLLALDAVLARPQFHALRRIEVNIGNPMDGVAADVQGAMPWATERGMLVIEECADTNQHEVDGTAAKSLLVWYEAPSMPLP